MELLKRKGMPAAPNTPSTFCSDIRTGTSSCNEATIAQDCVVGKKGKGTGHLLKAIVLYYRNYALIFAALGSVALVCALPCRLGNQSATALRLRMV